MIESKETLVGSLTSKQTIGGSVNVAEYAVYPELEDLEITPTKETQTYTHENSYGYNEVTVNPIPDEYIIPDGTLPITENATYDVRKFARVSTSVHPAPNLQDKEITIEENGNHNITADEEYEGLNQVNVKVAVKGNTVEDLTEELDTYNEELTEQETTITTIIETLQNKALKEINLQDKEINITTNGTQNIEADNGYDGLANVQVNVQVPTTEGATRVPMLTKDGLIEGLNETCEQFLRDLVYNQNPLLSYTTEPVTLYTPKDTHKFYIIRKKRNGGNYSVLWLTGCTFVYSTSLTSFYLKYFSFNNANLLTNKRKDISISIENIQNDESETYVSEDQTSLEDCIKIIQNLKTTTYTISTAYGFNCEGIDGMGAYYTNLPYNIDDAYTIQAQSRVISPKEVIQVLPS